MYRGGNAAVDRRDVILSEAKKREELDRRAGVRHCDRHVIRIEYHPITPCHQRGHSAALACLGGTACARLIRKLISVIAPSVATPSEASASVAAITVGDIAATGPTATGPTATAPAATAPAATINTARWRRRSIDLAARRRRIDLAAGRRRRGSIDLAARRRRRRSVDLAAGRRRRRSATTGVVRDGTIGNCEVGGSGVGRNNGGSDCESRSGHDGDPAEFQHHDTSPVILFGGEPALVVCQLRRQRRHKLEFPSR
jgi:hypothetical protein